MNLPDANFVAALCAILCPSLLMLFLLVPRRVANRQGRRTTRLGARLALSVLVLALVTALFRVIHGPIIQTFIGYGPLQLGVYVDTVSIVMLLLVSFLGSIICRYAVNYLDGDRDQGHFMKWLCVTIGSVLLIVVSGNLLMFTVAWITTSLSLHQLLTFYKTRPGAYLAARKKFLISRLGDCAMVALLVTAYQTFGTWDFQQIFAQLEILKNSPEALPPAITWISVFIVVGAMMKSAQFPFHSWLPDTMETPTPVSALMHAGIINAGGYLVVRLSPLVSLSPAALNTLALVGTFTALFASLIMLTQTSVKRSLAYSTIAQMGFMMMQCGLGAFALAMLHLVAHSLYKAHAFLSSGSIIKTAKENWHPTERPRSHPLILVLTLFSALAITMGTALLFQISFSAEPGVLVLGCIFMMAQAYFLWNLWAPRHSLKLVTYGLLAGLAASSAYFFLHKLTVALLETAVASYNPTRTLAEYVAMGVVVLLFMAMLILQAQLPEWSSTRLGRAFYVHAYKGFYFVTLANRVTMALTPRS